ncbi:amidase signature enzyme [Daldinia caldariorum]|uniref:amidase signature enzyme n=1 Tax=Daldinia caldariorum TaxID=326644 RepID=UPI00200865CF|nr:amidase signature enzyme [Daldinia caldariorum]KAI1471129.1 amidase signature enzyme [Daldinia caldariorum]
MSSSQRFSGYPLAKEGPDTAYIPAQDKNPPLRGLTLVIAAKLLNYFPSLAKASWKNAKLGCLKDIPELDPYDWHLQPIVTPLIADGVVQTKAEITPDLYERHPDDIAGRFFSAADYHELFKSGKLTPLHVAKAILPLITKGQNPPAKYESAWSVVKEDLVLEAAKKSTERYAAGQPLSVLDGVPIGVKDDTDVEGYISHVGRPFDPSDPFFQPATSTIWPVAQLVASGAIIIGKQVMHELGSDVSGCNPHWGTPINWNNKSYYPGGSSSGGGSAISSGLVPISIGTDAGGSIRVPASFNGAYGLKPTLHRTYTMRSSICAIGPLAATAKDLTIAYRLMTAPNPEDPIQGAFALSVPPSPSAKKTIGIYHEWFNQASPDVLDAAKKAIAYFKEKLGYEVVDIKIPYVQEAQYAHGAWALTEAISNHTSHAVDKTRPFAGLNSCNQLLLAMASCTSATDLLRYGQMRGLLMGHLAFLWKKYPGLLVLTPTVPEAGWPIHPGDQAYGFSDGNLTMRNMMYIWLANSTGCPAVTAPVGYVDPDQGEGKLPVGLMAMGEWGAEEQLLAWATEAETYVNEVYEGGRYRPQEWADVVELGKAVE